MADKERKNAGLDEVQRTVDQENEQGFRGVEVDSTPNENYSVAGVTAGRPTPETDKAQARKVREHVEDVSVRAEGVAHRDNN